MMSIICEGLAGVLNYFDDVVGIDPRRTLEESTDHVG